jgi:hypothetical protein
MFLSGDQAASKMRQTGKFYLWEGRIIGEAVVVTVTLNLNLSTPPSLSRRASTGRRPRIARTVAHVG